MNWIVWNSRQTPYRQTECRCVFLPHQHDLSIPEVLKVWCYSSWFIHSFFLSNLFFFRHEKKWVLRTTIFWRLFLEFHSNLSLEMLTFIFWKEEMKWDHFGGKIIGCGHMNMMNKSSEWILKWNINDILTLWMTKKLLYIQMRFFPFDVCLVRFLFSMRTKYQLIWTETKEKL